MTSMTRIYCIITLMLMLTILSGNAAPARKGRTILRQPDGQTFPAYIRGDEFTRIKTTEDGHAIIQDDNGWWCYAVYRTDGTKECSGWRVGSKVPQPVLDESRRIPYGTISEKAEFLHSSRNPNGEVSIIRRIRQSALDTRAGTEEEGPITKHGLVILAAFSDVRFKHTKEEFKRLLTEDGYSVNGATGSAKEYFDSQFNGEIIFDFTVSDIVTLPRTRAFYGANDNDGNDKAPAEMVRDACKAADTKIDFSLYDDDNDGTVDNVFLFFAGPDEAEGASEDCIWSHAWYIYSGSAGIDLVLDGKRIDRYACSSELSISYDTDGGAHEFINSIGTFCHEYSHTFGIPDFYDTDYEETGGMAAGFWGSTSLMDSGNYNNNGNTPPNFNCIERMILGIDMPVTINETGTYSMLPIDVSGRSYLLPAESENEFFLLECRDNKGWDAYIGGSGMLAYHIDLSEGVDHWNHLNEVNVNPSHQKADLLEADGRKDGFETIVEYAQARSSLSGLFFPYNGITSLTKESTPGLVSWDGSGCTFSIVNIRKEDSAIRFNLLGESGKEPPVASAITSESFTDAAIIRFSSSYPYDGEAEIKWGRAGYEKTSVSIEPYSTGKYALILEDLQSGGKTYEVTIAFNFGGIEGETRSVYVMTKRDPPVTWPYIYFNNQERNDDGSFMSGSRIPLRIYNASSAAEISWYFDGAEISHEGDGYYTLTRGGELKAIVRWEDGSSDTIVKNIKISE